MTDDLTLQRQITWVYTDDLERSSAFYGEVLGLVLVRDEGAARIFEVNAGAAIGVCTAFEDRVVEPRGGMISLVTNDVDAWYARIVAAGVQPDAPPHRLEQFGIYTFFVRDPAGYVVEFQSFDP